MMNAERINVAAFRVFADPIVISINASNFNRRGIYNKERIDVQNNTASSYRHTMAMQTDDVEGIPLEKNKNHTVTHDGTVYTVVDKINQSGGITELVLREYG